MMIKKKSLSFLVILIISFSFVSATQGVNIGVADSEIDNNFGGVKIIPITTTGSGGGGSNITEDYLLLNGSNANQDIDISSSYGIYGKFVDFIKGIFNSVEVTDNITLANEDTIITNPNQDVKMYIKWGALVVEG